MNKKEWLDNIYYNIGKQQFDFYLCGLRKVDGEVKSTKWKKYSEIIYPLNPNEDYKIKRINQRQILPIEIVLDIEEKIDLKSIMEQLKAIRIGNFKIYDTGSRGYHIHIFSSQVVLEPVKKFFISLFGGDMVKSGGKTMIALENCPHWKTGKIKKLVEKYESRFK